MVLGLQAKSCRPQLHKAGSQPPGSAGPFCLYIAWSSAGVMTSLEQALERLVWAEGAKNCHFLRTSWSSKPFLPQSLPGRFLSSQPLNRTGRTAMEESLARVQGPRACRRWQPDTVGLLRICDTPGFHKPLPSRSYSQFCPRQQWAPWASISAEAANTSEVYLSRIPTGTGAMCGIPQEGCRDSWGVSASRACTVGKGYDSTVQLQQ